MASSLRDAQKAVTEHMLRLNASCSEPNSLASITNHHLDHHLQRPFNEWKLLIMDSTGRDIMSPLWTLKELREYGVTLHMNLSSNREPIPEAPAVYLVAPTDASLDRICKDIESGLYKHYYVSFTSHCSRSLLERLAECAVDSNATFLIKKVYDQYCNFISLEHNFFVLTPQSNNLTFYSLNRVNTIGKEIDQLVNLMADGLFSILVTIGSVPLIRCSRGGYAEALAQALDQKLRNALNDTKNQFFSGGGFIGPISFRRPLLILLDRTFDLGTMLCHAWTYQSLIHDLMELKLNRLKMPEQSMPNTIYDLEDSDMFWRDHKASVFPCVAEDIQQELDNYRSSEDEIKRLKAAFGMGESDDDKVISMVSSSTAKLTTAVSSLPQLLERKRTLDMHTNIATSLLTIIKERKLDSYFGTEEKILAGTLSERSLDDFLQSEPGTPDDRLRLLLLYYIASKRNFNLEKSLSHCNEDASDAIKFVKRWKSFTTALMDVRDSNSAATVTSMFSDLLSKASHFAMEGVKNFVLNKKKVPLTCIVEHLMENRRNQETDNFACFDPKRTYQQGSDPPQQRNSFSDAIVFVVGGGNYVEYTNLCEYQKEKAMSDFRITYGTTQLTSPEMFLRQLISLGSEIH